MLQNRKIDQNLGQKLGCLNKNAVSMSWGSKKAQHFESKIKKQILDKQYSKNNNNVTLSETPSPTEESKQNNAATNMATKR